MTPWKSKQHLNPTKINETSRDSVTRCLQTAPSDKLGVKQQTKPSVKHAESVQRYQLGQLGKNRLGERLQGRGLSPTQQWLAGVFVLPAAGRWCFCESVSVFQWVCVSLCHHAPVSVHGFCLKCLLSFHAKWFIFYRRCKTLNFFCPERHQKRIRHLVLIDTNVWIHQRSLELLPADEEEGSQPEPEAAALHEVSPEISGNVGFWCVITLKFKGKIILLFKLISLKFILVFSLFCFEADCRKMKIVADWLGLGGRLGSADVRSSVNAPRRDISLLLGVLG